MKILEIKTLTFPEIKVVRYTRSKDQRGYFTEVFRKSEFLNGETKVFLKDVDFVQYNESFSKKGTIRGFHFQWNPYMGKLVRVIKGSMIDMAIDIRKGSPSYGKIIVYPLVTSLDYDFGEWIWVPPGFAHGIFYLEDTIIVYFCTSEYNPQCETSISPLSSDIDWSLVNQNIQMEFKQATKNLVLISEKDRNGFTLEDWKNNPNSENF